MAILGWLGWFGAGAWLGAAGWLGSFWGSSNGAEVRVGLLAGTRLDLVTPGLFGVVCGWVRPVGRMIWAFIRRLGSVIRTVGCHRTS
jgi:hypothetical protein